MKLWTDIKIGKARGIEINVHTTLLFIFLLIFVEVLPNFIYGLDIDSSIASLLTLPLIFFFVTIHELGHALTADKFGIATKKICLYPIGGIAYIDLQEDIEPKKELLISIAGPLTNLMFAALLFGIYWITPIGKELTIALAELNLIILAFNLLPAHPMDGGRIFKSLLLLWKGKNQSEKKQQLLVRYVALIIFTGFMGIGFLLNLYSLLIIGILFFIVNIVEVLIYRKKSEDDILIDKIKTKLRAQNKEIKDIKIERGTDGVMQKLIIVVEGEET